MKKTLLAMGLGLMATVSVAQDKPTFPVKMGFENADRTDIYHCPFANHVGLSDFGDWVNPHQDVDSWTEQSEEAAMNGEYGFEAKNTGKLNPWDRGIKFANLPIEEGKSYRMSFWIKGTEGAVMKSYISKGVEQLDKSFVNPAGQAVYGANGENDYVLSGDWQHVSFVAFYHGAAPFNSWLTNTSWAGGATVGDNVPEELWAGAGINESNKDNTYRNFWGGVVPEYYFGIINVYDEGTFYIDDILIEENKTFNQATTNGQVIKLDFGYQTNIAALAGATKKGECLMLDKTQFTVKEGAKNIEVISAEAHVDGFVYLFLNDNIDDVESVKISYTPNEENPLKYGADKRPSNSSEDMAVLGFTDEPCYVDESIDAETHFSEAPELESAIPAENSFDLPSTTTTFTFKFDSSVDPGNSNAKMTDANGKEIATTIEAGEDEKTMVIKADAATLKNGKYSIEIEAGNEAGESAYFTYEFSIGATGFDPEVSSELLFDTNFEMDGSGTVPANGKMIANSDGVSTLNPGEGRGSGPRIFKFAEGGQVSTALYLRDWADGYYYEVGTREDEVVELQEGKNTIEILYFNWKENNQNLNVQVFSLDEEGNEVEMLAEETYTKTMNVNGSNNGVVIDGAPVETITLNMEETTRVGIRVKGTGEYMIGYIKVNSVPEIAGIESKTKLWKAIEEAYNFYWANDPVENERYDVKEFKALEDEINKYLDDGEPKDGWEKLGMTNAAEYDEAIANINAILKNAKDFKEVAGEYDKYRVEGGAIEQALNDKADSKYASLECYKTLKDTYETYKDKELTDLDELKTATSLLKNNLYMVKIMSGDKVKPNLDVIADWATPGKVGIPALTARIDMAVKTIEAMDPDYTEEEAEIMSKAMEALTDDDNIAEQLKRIAGKYYYKAMTNKDENFFAEKFAPYDEETGTGGEMLSDGTYDFSFFLKNPNVYVQSTSDSQSGNLESTNIGTEDEPEIVYSGSACPGWTISEGSGSWSIGWGDLSWSALNVDGEKIPAEAMFSNWGGNYTVSQTVKDLPAGLYVLKAGINERDTFQDDTYFFWQTSADIENLDRVQMVVPKTGQNWFTSNVSSARRDADFDEDGQEITTDEDGAPIEGAEDAEPIEILDGVLTIGAHAGANSHIFMNNFAIYLVGSSAEANYEKLAEDWANGIQTVKNAKLKSVAVYDLNGAQKMHATKGVNIVKRTYSDGSVKVSKYLVK